MTDTPKKGEDDARARLSDKPSYELYFVAPYMTNSERYAAMRSNEEELLQRISQIHDPAKCLENQLKTLDVLFHSSALRGCSNGNSDDLKDAFTAQKLFRESLKFLHRKDKP